jgi:nicotinamidase-related amidase
MIRRGGGMGTNLTFDFDRTAVVALDCQAGVVSIYVKPAEAFLARASGVLGAARKARLPVIHVKVGFRPGLPEVSARNKLLASIKASTEHQRLFEGSVGAIHPALGPEESDLVVTKHRLSAFAGTDLEMLLRAKDIHTLILFGIATSGVVLSTLLEACDADYNVVVISDCCTDLDPQLHEALIARLFPQRGLVVTAAETVEALEAVAN